MFKDLTMNETMVLDGGKLGWNDMGFYISGAGGAVIGFAVAGPPGAFFGGIAASGIYALLDQ